MSRKGYLSHGVCMIMSGQAYIIQRESDGREPMTKTRLTPRSYPPVAVQARLRSRQVTRKKTGENRRRFSTTTGIKDNPIRLELILGELHFSSAKYSVTALLHGRGSLFFHRLSCFLQFSFAVNFDDNCPPILMFNYYSTSLVAILHGHR